MYAFLCEKCMYYVYNMYYVYMYILKGRLEPRLVAMHHRDLNPDLSLCKTTALPVELCYAKSFRNQPPLKPSLLALTSFGLANSTRHRCDKPPLLILTPPQADTHIPEIKSWRPPTGVLELTMAAAHERLSRVDQLSQSSLEQSKQRLVSNEAGTESFWRSIAQLVEQSSCSKKDPGSSLVAAIANSLDYSLPFKT